MSSVAKRRGMPSRAAVRAPSDRRFKRHDAGLVRRRRFAQIVRRSWRGVTTAVVAMVAVGWAATSLFGARALAVDAVVVRGNTRLPDTEIVARLDGILGENILLVNFEAYRLKVLESPWVAAVTLARVLPSTIRVDITERVPMAVARLGSQLFLVDEAGVIIDEFGPEHAEYDLLIVDGLVSRPSRGAPLADPDRVRLVTRCLASLGQQPDLRRRVSQLKIAGARDVAALLVDDPAWLHLGDAMFVERLEAYVEVAPALRERYPDLDDVDLRFADRLVVRTQGKSTELARY